MIISLKPQIFLNKSHWNNTQTFWVVYYLASKTDTILDKTAISKLQIFCTDFKTRYIRKIRTEWYIVIEYILYFKSKFIGIQTFCQKITFSPVKGSTIHIPQKIKNSPLIQDFVQILRFFINFLTWLLFLIFRQVEQLIT